MAEQESPTASLIHDHAVVGVVIAAMEREARRIRETGEIDADDVRRMVDFTRGFTDGCHHTKEERALFPRLLERSPQAQGPVAVMLREHDGGRARIAAVAGALEKARRGDAPARLVVADNLAGYASLLFAHIAKENNVLFPLADRELGADDQRWLSGEFARVEREDAGAGEHERWLALARELEHVAE
jgi:hemerythrin-like domain-containing protein